MLCKLHARLLLTSRCYKLWQTLSKVAYKRLHVRYDVFDVSDAEVYASRHQSDCEAHQKELKRRAAERRRRRRQLGRSTEAPHRHQEPAQHHLLAPEERGALAGLGDAFQEPCCPVEYDSAKAVLAGGAGGGRVVVLKLAQRGRAPHAGARRVVLASKEWSVLL